MILIAPKKAPLNDASRKFLLDRTLYMLNLLLEDETTDHFTFDLADEARVKVLAALDSLRRTA